MAVAGDGLLVVSDEFKVSFKVVLGYTFPKRECPMQDLLSK